MKYCAKCGKQLPDGAIFCSACGTKQNNQIQTEQQYVSVYPQQQYGYAANTDTYNYVNVINSEVNQVYADMNNHKNSKAGKSGHRKALVICIILFLLVGLGAGAYFVFFGKDKKQSANDVQKAKEKVLDDYFEALTNMDFEAIYKLNSPNSDERFNIGTDRATLAELLTDLYHYPRGATIDNSSYMLSNTEVSDVYLKSYGFSGYYEGGMDEYRNVNRDNELFKEKYKDFKVEYELISLDKASNYKISRGNGLSPVNDMKQYISHEMDLDVDDVYVAKIHIKWSYGDKRYGFDKSWWNNAVYKEIMDNQGITDKKTGKILSSYNELVDFYDSMVYDVFLYETYGEWYIFNINMRDNGYGWSVE